jgi:hypothetical protein
VGGYFKNSEQRSQLPPVAAVNQPKEAVLITEQPEVIDDKIFPDY